MRDRQPASIERGGQVQRDDLVPFVDWKEFNRGDVLHPGIVDQHVNWPGSGQQRLNPIAPRQIGGHDDVLAALNNLRGTVDKRRWVMAFVFGLIHGFGFASVLADLGLPQGALVLALIGFNVGVELGQLAIVALFLPLAFWLRATRFYRVGVLTGGSIVVALLASWWFVQRAFVL